ncbi:MAG: hypothetical protein ACI8W8_002214 [Rhodothermales bacterium]|jgi:hypothetical protein
MADAPVAEPTAKKGKGCLYKGCFFSMAGMLLIMGIVMLKMFSMIKGAYEFKEEFISEEPMQVAVYTPSAPEKAAVAGKVDALVSSLSEGTGSQFEFTDREINTVIAQSSLMQELGAKANVEIRGQSMTGDVSLPLESIGWESYFNCEFDVDVTTDGGMLRLFFNDLKFGGQDVPKPLMNKVNSLIEEAYKHPKVREVMQQSDLIEVQDNVLKIVTQAKNGRVNRR